MPSFISKDGEFYPAKEKVGLTNKSNKPINYNGKVIQPNEPFIYEGPDRAALQLLHEMGETKLGSNFKYSPDFRQAVRNQGFETVEQYLENIGYDAKKAEKEFNEKAVVINKHELPQKAREVIIMGGGKDTTGNKENDIVGGFGPEKLRKASEVK